MGVFYTAIACYRSWDTWRPLSQEVGLSETETYSCAKMTAKCPMSADMQYRCKTHPCDHFNPYKSILCSKSHEVTLMSSFELFAELRKGESSVRSTDDTSAYKVYIVLDNSLGIQKDHICATVTRHVTELEQFQNILVFFLTFSICVFFSELIISIVL